MKNNFTKVILATSIAINLLVAIPALALLFSSTDIQYALYQGILAPRLGTPKIAFIGDSITRGGGIWAFKINEYNFDVWNFGHGGLTTRQLQYYANKVASYKPQYAFIMAGINDQDKSIEGAHTSYLDYKRILETLMEAGITPIIQLTLYRENEKNPEYIDELNRHLIAFSEGNGIMIIDLNPLLCPEKSLLPEYSLDGTHLTPSAYKVWAQEIRRVLKKKL